MSTRRFCSVPRNGALPAIGSLVSNTSVTNAGVTPILGATPGGMQCTTGWGGGTTHAQWAAVSWAGLSPVAAAPTAGVNAARPAIPSTTDKTIRS